MSKHVITHRLALVSCLMRLVISIPALTLISLAIESTGKLIYVYHPTLYDGVITAEGFAKFLVTVEWIMYVIKICRNGTLYFRLKKRQKSLDEFSVRQRLEQSTGTKLFQSSSLAIIGGQRGSGPPKTFLTSLYPHSYSSPGVFSNVVSHSDWVYADYTYQKHTFLPTERGDISYVSVNTYYSVMTVELPRDLPNVFFDSRKSRGHQFSATFDGNQVTSLEGDFSEYFDVYFPYDYQIDSLSFITPEVMLAMRDASDYDIEIVDNQLYLYGALGDPATQIPDMSSKLLSIKEQLLSNIVAYQDTRLNTTNRTRAVSKFGVRLQNSLKPKILALLTTLGSLVLCMMMVASSAVQACSGDPIYNIVTQCPNTSYIFTTLYDAWVIWAPFIIVALFISFGILREAQQHRAFRRHRMQRKRPQMQAPIARQ